MNPRDPRARRGGVFAPPVDALAAAVRLEVAVDAMRADARQSGPVLGEPVDAEPLTAQAFADALAAGDEDEEPTTVVGEPAPADTAERADSDRAATVADHRPAAPAFSSEHPRLTWRSRHDPRSLEYGIRAVLAGSAPLTDHLWPTGPVLDQGKEGACVGFGIEDAVAVLDLIAGERPRNTGAEQQQAEAIYHRAQQLDDVPGEAYSGTSVLAGMKAAVEAGLFGGYRWAFGTKDVAQAVLQAGPVVVGVPWWSGMYDTGPGGLVTVTGEDTGAGHCLAVVGIRLHGPQGQAGPYFVWQNSWGPSYGDGGLGYIHHRDLAGLLHGTGEAAIPTRAAR